MEEPRLTGGAFSLSEVCNPKSLQAFAAPKHAASSPCTS